MLLSLFFIAMPHFPINLEPARAHRSGDQQCHYEIYNPVTGKTENVCQ